MDIKLYNTLTRQKDVFVPQHSRKAGMYTCGPTVYAEAHIGNLRSYLFPDILKKLLVALDYEVKHIINITDVGHLTSDADMGEDKLENAARSENKTAWKLAEHYTQCFQRDLERLQIAPASLFPKATDHIPEQIALIEQLQQKGFVYATSDGLYFDTSQLPEYGKLARLKTEGLQAGIRVDQGEKRQKTDFALWKNCTQNMKRQMEWQSPWGTGFPGWHLECSAMAAAHLGHTLDIHTGGMDHIPIHHTNEIAQSEAAHGCTLANYWLHGAFLVMDTKDTTRMGKSKGNVITLEQIIQQSMPPLSFRYLALGCHYRQYLHFSWQALQGANTGLQNLHKLTQRLGISAEQADNSQWEQAAKYSGELARKHQVVADWLQVLCDDLNTPRALGMLWEQLQQPTLTKQEQTALLQAAEGLLSLGLLQHEARVAIPEHVRTIAEQRLVARQQKHYAESDRLRKALLEAGFSVQDHEASYTLTPL